MTPQEKRIAIAEACGWTIETEKEPQSWVFGGWPPNTPEYGKTVETAYYQELPNYLSDLNAMHEAEKVLTEQQQTGYADNLYHLIPDDLLADTDPDTGQEIWIASQFMFAHATAAQRADAFLLSLGHKL